jgi:hypothetical protein
MFLLLTEGVLRIERCTGGGSQSHGGMPKIVVHRSVKAGKDRLSFVVLNQDYCRSCRITKPKRRAKLEWQILYPGSPASVTVIPIPGASLELQCASLKLPQEVLLYCTWKAGLLCRPSTCTVSTSIFLDPGVFVPGKHGREA